MATVVADLALGFPRGRHLERTGRASGVIDGSAGPGAGVIEGR